MTTRRPKLAYAQQVAVPPTDPGEQLARSLWTQLEFFGEDRSLFLDVHGINGALVRTDPTHQTAAKRAALLMRILTARPREIDEMEMP